MRYTPIQNNFYTKNRNKLADMLAPKSIALAFSNAVLPTNADGVMGFKQNNDLFYLTGIDQEETILFMCPDHPDENLRTVLFIRESNEHIKIWEGDKLTKQQAFELSGIKNIQWCHQFERFLKRQAFEVDTFYINQNEHDGADLKFVSLSVDWIFKLKQFYPLHNFARLSPLLKELRLVKKKEEIEQIKKAIEITKNSFFRALNFCSPNCFEFEIEAEITHDFLKNRSRGHAFQPIVASGKNACVLHYISNNEICKDGDTILLDFGAEYGNYNADLTRCFPVNGKFTNRQKEVYSSVLSILKETKKLMVAGNTMQALKDQVNVLFKIELINLKLYTDSDFDGSDNDKTLISRYFPHGVSHHLGLDVHDVSNRYGTFEIGNLLTCEPGIYIPEEGIGIRLENDILITADGNIDLVENVPIEIDEIEALMSKS